MFISLKYVRMIFTLVCVCINYVYIIVYVHNYVDDTHVATQDAEQVGFLHYKTHQC